ncbi:DUF2973 domain-containing protein [Cyanobium sp. BSA11S]|uniref:DUF2973 domain-containing protein n=1 Tax=Cyanobium sp. BSA11S TaxID=3108224 RepID=UPI003D815DBD
MHAGADLAGLQGDGPGLLGHSSPKRSTNPSVQPWGLPPPDDIGPQADRTGRLTIHPELLDADGRITSEDLLTVRFGSDNDPPRLPTESD